MGLMAFSLETRISRQSPVPFDGTGQTHPASNTPDFRSELDYFEFEN
jgi:hypothetical protein